MNLQADEALLNKCHFSFLKVRKELAEKIIQDPFASVSTEKEA